MAEGAKLEDRVADARVGDIDPAGPITVVSAIWSGSQAVNLVYRHPHGVLWEHVAFRANEGTFAIAPNTAQAWSFDANGARCMRSRPKWWARSRGRRVAVAPGRLR